MATEKFTFLADVKNFIAGNLKMREVSKKTAETVGKAGKGIAGAFDVGKNLGANIGGWASAAAHSFSAVKGMAGTAFEFVKGLTDAAGATETLTTRFTVLQGSSEKAGKMVSYLKDFAAKTPFSLNELSDAAATLLAFTGDAEKSKVVLKQLGDVAAATGADVGELASIYGKIGAVGKMDTEAVNQLSERGINVREMLAARDGISGADVQKNMEKGVYGQKDLDYIFGKLTSAGGMAEGAMEKLSSTYDGLVSTLMDNIEQVKSTMGEYLLPMVKSGLQSFIDKIQNNGDEIKAAGATFAQYMVALWEGLKGGVEFLTHDLPAAFARIVDGLTYGLSLGHWGTHLEDGFKDTLYEQNLKAIKAEKARAETEAELNRKQGVTLRDTAEEVRQQIEKVSSIAKLDDAAKTVDDVKKQLDDLKQEEWGALDKTKQENIAELEAMVPEMEKELAARRALLEQQEKAAELEKRANEEKAAAAKAEAEAAKIRKQQEKRQSEREQSETLAAQKKMNLQEQWDDIDDEGARLGLDLNDIDSSIEKKRQHWESLGWDTSRLDSLQAQVDAARARSAEYDEEAERLKRQKDIDDAYLVSDANGKMVEAQYAAADRMKELMEKGFDEETARTQAANEIGRTMVSADGYRMPVAIGGDGLSRFGGAGNHIVVSSDPVTKASAKATMRMVEDTAQTKDTIKQIYDKLSSLTAVQGTSIQVVQ